MNKLPIAGKLRRAELANSFLNILQESPISDKLKVIILGHYNACTSTISKLCQSQRYHDIDTLICFEEYDKLRKKLDTYTIFSEDFKDMIYIHFCLLITSFDEHIK